MPANPKVSFQGKAHWNSFPGMDKYGKWSIKLYLDKPSVDKFRDLQAEHGILTRLQKDDEGYYTNLGRYQKKVYGIREIIFNPPVVVERDDKTPFQGKIGHGSDVTITCELYPYTIPASGGKKGRALRLEAVRVDNLVPYDAQEHSTDREAKQLSGLLNTTPQAAY